VLEVVGLCADLGCRTQYTGPVEVSRCLHLLAGSDMVKMLVRLGNYIEAVKREAREETVRVKRAGTEKVNPKSKYVCPQAETVTFRRCSWIYGFLAQVGILFVAPWS
jgi:hypothetical protein